MAPLHIHVEVVSALRSRLIRRDVSPELADFAHQQFQLLEFELYDYLPLAARIWQLKENVTPYDAWYVALAEYLEEPLATLDGNLIRSPGPRCRFLTYEP